MLRLALTGVIVTAGIFFMPQMSAAAGVIPPGAQITHQSLVEPVQYRRCRAWYRECRVRWRGGWRFRRCLARHGC
ncbi:MAG TPA: glycosyl hydrolase family 5 [Hyphomicrobiaceae bacterium]|jgi:hypothetical protein|nr:glycosyl hydrolase family 5 [Hyphomicrobiaceae bacterium]